MREVNGRAAVPRASRTRIDIGFTGVLLVGMNVVAGVIIWALWRGLRMSDLGGVARVLIGFGAALFVVGLVGMIVQSARARWHRRRAAHVVAAPPRATGAVADVVAPVDPANEVDQADETDNIDEIYEDRHEHERRAVHAGLIDIAVERGRRFGDPATEPYRVPTIRLRDHRVMVEDDYGELDDMDDDRDDDLDDDVDAVDGEDGDDRDDLDSLDDSPESSEPALDEPATGPYSGFYDDFDDDESDEVDEVDELDDVVDVEGVEGVESASSDPGVPSAIADAILVPHVGNDSEVDDEPPIQMPRRTHIRIGRPERANLRVAESPAIEPSVIVPGVVDPALSLERLRGLGATMRHRLTQLGYRTQVELSRLDDSVVEDVAADLGTFPSRLSSWVTQARRNVDRTPDRGISRTA